MRRRVALILSSVFSSILFCGSEDGVTSLIRWSPVRVRYPGTNLWISSVVEQRRLSGQCLAMILRIPLIKYAALRHTFLSGSKIGVPSETSGSTPALQ